MDRIEAMRTLLCVVREGSFTAAAARLNISAQLVSKYVAQLEAKLGARLLNRTTRKLHLTEAGERFVPKAQQVLEELEELENIVGDYQHQTQGQLRISAPVSFALQHLGQALVQYQQQHPAVAIDIQLNDRKVDIVDEGFDIALRIGQLKSSSLVAKYLSPIHLVYCASPSYLKTFGEPENLEALSEHRFLHYSFREQGQLPQQLGPSAFSCNNGDLLTQSAIAGAGIILQPTFIAAPGLKTGKLQVILKAHQPKPLGLYAVYNHRTLLANKLRTFIDFIAQHYGDKPYWDEGLDLN